MMRQGRPRVSLRSTRATALPDDVVFVDEIPHTATGKIQKLTLRQQFKDYVLPNVQAAE